MKRSSVALMALAWTTSPALAEPMILADANMDEVTAGSAVLDLPIHLPWILW